MRSPSPRQVDILELVAGGLSDKEVARALGIQPRTVRTHLERMYARYGFRSRVDAAMFWIASRRDS